MSDIRIEFDEENLVGDLLISGGDLAIEEGLETAVVMSIFTDARALDDDELPGNDSDPRGWWADEFAQVEDDEIGSRAWLLERTRLNDETVVRAQGFYQQALQWLVDDGVAERVDVQVERVDLSIARIDVQIFRPERDPVRFRFNALWEAQFDGV